MQAAAKKSTGHPATTAPAAAPRLVHRQASAASAVAASSLRISSPHDPAEREASRTAQTVMRMASPAPLSSPAGALGGTGLQIARRSNHVEEKRLRETLPAPSIARFASTGILDGAQTARGGLQRKELKEQPGSSERTPDIGVLISSQLSGGVPLPASLRTSMQARFHANFANVRIHSDAAAAGLSRKIHAHAFTVGNHIFFGQNQFRPDSPDGQELIAHELTHTIQQGAAQQEPRHAQRAEDPAITQQTVPHLQRSWLTDWIPSLDTILNFFADQANLIPGFRMFTIVIGMNPVNGKPVDTSTANILRAIVEILPGGGLITKALDQYGVFEKAGAWVDGQLKSLGITGASIKAAIDRFLKTLDISSIVNPGKVWEDAKAILGEPVSRLIAFVKSLGDAILKFIKDAILKPLAGLASKTDGWDLLCAVLGTNPITGENVPRNADTLIGGFMKLIGQTEIWENIKKGNAIAKAWAWFQTALGELLGFVKQIPQLFIDALKSLAVDDLLNLTRALVKVAKVFGNFFVKFTTWAGNTIWNLLEIIFSVVAPQVLVYIKKAAGAFRTILKDPIRFAGTLLAAAKAGFNKFAGNILTHLKNAIINWLTGSLAGAGVYIPQAFSLIEIGKFVLSVLGITWTKIRAKIVKVLPGGETAMKILEGGFDVVVAFIKDGPAAAWNIIKEKLSDLKDVAVQMILDIIKSKIVTAAVKKVLSLLSPIGAFIQSVLTIWDTIVFFKEKLAQIAQVVAAFIDMLAELAAGVVTTAATKIESVLAGLLTLVIGFLANFAGLGKVSDSVSEAIKNLQARVDAAIDAALQFVVNKAKAFLAILKGGDKKDERTEEQKKADLAGALDEGDALLGVAEPNIEQIRAELPRIKGKYRLVALELMIDSTSADEDTVHIHGEVNPKNDKGKHRVPKGGPDATIDNAHVTFERFKKWRTSTKVALQKRFIEEGGPAGIYKGTKGNFRSKNKWHRRHVVSWADTKQYFIDVFGGKKVAHAAEILRKDLNTKGEVKSELPAVVQEIKRRARDAFNDAENLYTGSGPDNSSLQKALDTESPDVLDEGKVSDEKLDAKVAKFIANHAFVGTQFKVTTKVVDETAEFVKKTTEYVFWDVYLDVSSEE